MKQKKEGMADISLTISLPSIHIKAIDKHTFDILKQKRCADHLILSYNASQNAWSVHIFELTKTISFSNWTDKILPQLEGAIGNAYAISGILHINSFEAFYLHCGYRRNKSESSTVEFHRPLGEPVEDDWLTAPINLSAFPEITTQSQPIRLDPETGRGEMKI